MGLMMVNRHRFIGHQIPVVVPIIPPYVPSTPVIPTPQPPPVTQGYVAEDFGENAINNHSASHEAHSDKNQVIFDYVTKDFRDRCTSYESYKTAPYNSFVWDELEACKTLKADIVYTPYVNAAVWTNTDNDNFILTVGSHYDNDGGSYWDNPVGSDNNRHDITANAETFLSDSIAVSARRDTPELFKNSTSEGYGMEFFEDCSPEGLDADYPNEDMPAPFAEILTDDGTTLFSTVHLRFSDYIRVGKLITVRLPGSSSNWVTTTITEIIDGNHIKVSPAINPITSGNIYAWHDVTLGVYTGQAQSWAVPLVAGKLKVIKMSTNSDWETVRAAARATAKRNPTGIPEIDNANWDIYRGFGCIQVQDAINYINNN